MRAFARSVSLQQPGDPSRFAQAVLKLVSSPPKPLRLPLGSDTVGAIEAKHQFVMGELAEWRTVALSTDFPR